MNTMIRWPLAVLAIVWASAAFAQTPDPRAAGDPALPWRRPGLGEMGLAGEVGHQANGMPIVTDVVRPVLLHYPAEKGKAVGAAMVVAPGGGFRALMMSYEGADIATAGFADQSAPSGTDSAAGDTLISQHYAAANLNATEFLFKFAAPIWSHADDLQTIQTSLQDGGGFATVEGPLAFSGQALTPAQLVAIHDGGSTPAAAALARFVSPDGRTVQYIGVEHGGAALPISAVPTVRDLTTRTGASVHAVADGVFGIQPFAFDVDKLSSSDLWHIIPVVAILIAILLAIVMRSLVAPLYLVTSVLLSYLAALGLTALIFVHFGGQDGINFVLPFLMFVFLMALGSDYNVLVMTRIREESHHLRTGEAVRKAIGATGTTVTTAGLILGGTFAVLAFAGGGASGGSQIQQIGYGVAFGVVMDTFVVRTILVPAIVVLLGRRNWWPSSLWRDGEPPETPESVTAAPAPQQELQTTAP